MCYNFIEFYCVALSSFEFRRIPEKFWLNSVKLVLISIQNEPLHGSKKFKEFHSLNFQFILSFYELDEFLPAFRILINIFLRIFVLELNCLSLFECI